MLASYITNTQTLLQLPTAPQSLYTTPQVTSWINISRGQLAGESRAIRRIGSLTTSVGVRNYNFSSITLGDSSVAGVIHVRDLYFNIGTGLQFVEPHEWPWFRLYYMNNAAPQNGMPQRWSQFGQGSASTNITAGGSGAISSGSLYIDPPPDIAYTLNMDCVCYPAPLAQDTDPEAIPYLWTDAVPFFAAYYALLSAQTQARMQDAQNYLALYQQFVNRARNAATPDVSSYLYDQVPDIAQQAKFGIGPQRGGQ